MLRFALIALVASWGLAPLSLAEEIYQDESNNACTGPQALQAYNLLAPEPGRDSVEFACTRLATLAINRRLENAPQLPELFSLCSTSTDKILCQVTRDTLRGNMYDDTALTCTGTKL